MDILFCVPEIRSCKKGTAYILIWTAYSLIVSNSVTFTPIPLKITFKSL